MLFSSQLFLLTNSGWFQPFLFRGELIVFWWPNTNTNTIWLFKNYQRGWGLKGGFQRGGGGFKEKETLTVNWCCIRWTCAIWNWTPCLHFGNRKWFLFSFILFTKSLMFKNISQYPHWLWNRKQFKFLELLHVPRNMRAFGDVVQLLLLVFIIIIVVVVYTQLLFSAGDNVNRVGVRHYYACTHRGNMQDCQIKPHLQTQIHVKMQIQLQHQRQIQPKYREIHWDSVNMQDCQISQTRLSPPVAKYWYWSWFFLGMPW